MHKITSDCRIQIIHIIKPRLTVLDVGPRMTGYNKAEQTTRRDAAPRIKLEEGAELIGTPHDEDAYAGTPRECILPSGRMGTLTVSISYHVVAMCQLFTKRFTFIFYSVKVPLTVT